MKDLRAILPSRSRTHTIALAVGAGTWVAGFFSVYLVVPLNTGLNLWQSYAAFQTGSHAGNVLAVVVYAAWGAGVLFVVRGSILSAPTAVLAAHGLMGVGIFYPAAVMSFAVAHLTGYGDDSDYQSGVAMPLVLSGGYALVALLAWVVVGNIVRGLMKRSGKSA
ncbi:hypothetical protein ACFY5D_01035 [Paeniglutamicibacter sp. NPDC012692]|uniref:hypothetical protein n=1 Tax=Paeniglutamicibacter sp. NPDC012692 TaxID=3364388 RepID=UPI00367CFE83